MNLVTLDFETYWSDTHTLRKMSNIEYVMHPDTEIISCSIKINGGWTEVWFGENQIRPAFADIDWDDTMVIGHNMSEFDALVLAWRFGIRPKMWGCTMAMARPIHAKTTGLSLGALVQHYGIGVKDNTALVQTKGKRLKEFDPFELEAMRRYNKDDTEQCYALFHELRKHYTAKELVLIDMTIRAMVEPKFLVDHTLLEQVLDKVRANKKKQLVALAHMIRAMRGKEFDLTAETLDWDNADDIAEYVRAELASAPKFSAMLEKLGVEVPTKPSPTNPEKMIPALSKTDEGFIELQSHPDPLVSMAAGARLGVKSVQLETRIETFLKVCDATEGYLPVPLKYCGADTTGRWSGYQYNCFSGGVEVLTPGGWVRFDAWRGEPIMQWWPDGRLTFEENPARLEKDYDGTMYAFRGPLASFTVTPEHRLVSVREGRVRERTAQQVAESSGLDGIPAAGVWRGEANSLFTPAEVRLLVAIAADGCVVPRAKGLPTVQLGFRRRRKIERMRRLLADVGVPYYERAYPPQDTHTGGHDTVTFVIPNCPYQKGFGPWILRLGRDALDAFVDELPHWDGQRHHKSGNTCFWTSSVLEAEWCSTALHLSGTPATVRTYAGNKVLVYARSGKFTAIETDRHVTPLHHSGKVYCAGVESSYIMVRFDSRISVVGQCQNLPRINPNKRQLSDALRLCMQAPAGHTIIVADQSAIELRVNHFLWKVESSMALFRENPQADLYRAFAAARYGVTPEEVDKLQRQVAKVAQLGLGFGAAWRTFQQVAKIMGGIDLTDEEAQEIVLDWRREYADIVNGWRTCHDSLPHIEAGREREIDPWGLCHTSKHGIHLPSGRIIRYPELRYEEDENSGKREWWYGRGRHKARIYAGKITENIVQALARDTVADNAVEFRQLTGLSFSLMVHDELAYVVPKEEAVDKLHTLQTIMRRPPKWWPELITWSEGDSAARYGLAK